ncbi:MAG: hydroxyacid dehydrogenase [Alphaproteobacteria bacterium]|nr:hydroxyacid dehydrogenase [Alphaproteobacteria bacterium]
MAKVVCYGAIAPAGMAVLAERSDVRTETVLPGDGAARLGAALAEADAVIVRYYPFGRDVVAAAPRLKVVCRYGVGYDNIDVAALTERGIPLATVGDVNAVTVAEHALYLMLAVAKTGPLLDHATRAGGFVASREALATTELWRKTLLVVGFGRIGRRVAARAKAFEMAVLVNDPYLDDAALAGCERVRDLAAALPRADFVTLHVPANAETRHLIAAPQLGLMKPTAVLINTARGSIVDEAALSEALGEARLGGAGLDVYAEEPPQPTNPLFGSARTVLTPHCAGLTRECANRMAEVCARTALAALAGRLDPALIVNQEALARGS